MPKLYELRKDCWTPAGYWRAGLKKTEKEWKRLFPFQNIGWCTEWFIDISKEDNKLPHDELWKIIDAVFTRKQLNSISYKEAAREIALLYAKTLEK